MSMLTGVFATRDGAECAYRSVLERGYQPADISLLMSDETRSRWFLEHPSRTELGDQVVEDADKAKGKPALGGPGSGTAGAIAPVVAAVGVLALLPGLGIVITGPVAAAVAAAGAVGLAGGLVGALADWGVPKDRVEQYATAMRNGAMLLGVKPRSEEDSSLLRQAWEACGGRQIHS